MPVQYLRTNTVWYCFVLLRRQLHRQVETERRSRTDLEQESQLMRQRMMGTAGVATSAELRGPTRSVGEFLSSSGAGSGGMRQEGICFEAPHLVHRPPVLPLQQQEMRVARVLYQYSAEPPLA